MNIVPLESISPSVESDPNTALWCLSLGRSAKRNGCKVLAMIGDFGDVYIGTRSADASDMGIHRVGSVYMEKSDFNEGLSRVCRICLKEIAAW